MFFAVMPESGQPKCRLLRYRIHQEELPIWFGPEYRMLADRSGIVLEAQPVEGTPGAKTPEPNPQAKALAASPDERNDGFPTNLFDF